MRAIIVRYCGSNYGVKVLDDLLNPQDNTKFNKHNKYKRALNDISSPPSPGSPIQIESKTNKLEKDKSKRKKTNRRTVEEELALVDETFAKIQNLNSETRDETITNSPVESLIQPHKQDSIADLPFEEI